MLISKLLANFAKPLAKSLQYRWSGEPSGYTGPPLHVVSATRLPETAFWETSHLGLSFRRADFIMPLRHTIAFENSRGLSAIYNSAIDAMDPDEIAVFVHDDVVLYDFFLPHRVTQGLQHFDVIGVVGNAAPKSDHAGWGARLPPGCQQPIHEQAEGEVPQHSGAVNHLFPTHELASRFGLAPRRVSLLDGLFLAARVSTLRRHNVRFDERFAFHFYDLDFCRTCVAQGLKLGTWPIALGHASAGSYGSPAWHSALAGYRAKWGMKAPRL